MPDMLSWATLRGCLYQTHWDAILPKSLHVKASTEEIRCVRLWVTLRGSAAATRPGRRVQL